MRISDWSSDVCSSDLREELALADLHGNLVEGGELAEPPGHAVDLDDGPVVQRSPPLAPTRLAARRRIASATDSRTKEATSSTLPSARICGSLPGKRSRSEEHTSELQSLMRNSYAVFCLKKKKHTQPNTPDTCQQR